MLRNICFKRALAVLLAGVLILPASFALADDWEAVKLRGGVFAFDGAGWVKLERGSIISDERVIRTTRNGRAQFVRDGETVDIGGNTQIRIYGEYRDGFTVVQQHFGVVDVEAEVQNVKHFAVQTPHLAAVVKGTRFRVTSNEDSAEVSVERGKVEVRDEAREQTVNVNPGQSATVSDTQPVEVSGSGPVEAVVAFNGEVVVPARAENNARGSNSNNGNRGTLFGGSRNSDDDEEDFDDDGDDDERGNNGNGNGNSSSSSNNGNGHGAGGNGNGNNGNGNGNGGSSGDDDDDDDDDDSPGNSGSSNGNNGNGNGHGAGGSKKDDDD